MHALWKKRPDLASHIANIEFHQGNATCHTTRNTIIEIAVLGLKRAIHQPYSTNLAYVFLIWSRIYDEHDLIIELISFMRYKKCNLSAYRAWFMNVDQK